jgi:hypothetical protein
MGGGGGDDDGDDGQFVVAVWAALDAINGWNAVGQWGVGGYGIRSGGGGVGNVVGYEVAGARWASWRACQSATRQRREQVGGVWESSLI